MIDLKKRDDIDERIEQMMRVFTVLHEKGLSFTDSLDVLRAFYEPDLPAHNNQEPT